MKPSNLANFSSQEVSKTIQAWLAPCWGKGMRTCQKAKCIDDQLQWIRGTPVKLREMRRSERGTAGIKDHRTRIVQERDLIVIGIYTDFMGACFRSTVIRILINLKDSSSKLWLNSTIENKERDQICYLRSFFSLRGGKWLEKWSVS